MSLSQTRKWVWVQTNYPLKRAICLGWSYQHKHSWFVGKEWSIQTWFQVDQLLLFPTREWVKITDPETHQFPEIECLVFALAGLSWGCFALFWYYIVTMSVWLRIVDAPSGAWECTVVWWAGWVGKSHSHNCWLPLQLIPCYPNCHLSTILAQQVLQVLHLCWCRSAWKCVGSQSAEGGSVPIFSKDMNWDIWSSSNEQKSIEIRIEKPIIDNVDNSI